MFVWDKNDLNDEQSDAILNENNVFLIACPGSGKTRTLTYKVAYELSKIDNSKQYIIAITYTNRAADEVKERIELLGVDTKQLWIGTIHSFCLEWILRPYSLYLPKLKNGFRVIDSFETEKMISAICTNYNKRNNLRGRNGITHWDCQFFATPNLDFTITNTNNEKKEGIKEILKKYFNELNKNDQLDFEHILFYSLKLLKEKEIISSILSNIFPYILVDEYQDTREIQYHIIGSILKASQKKSKLFIVGDPNQSIFQNLGAYPIEKIELEDITGLEIDRMDLHKNYRSSEKLIEYFEYFKSYDNNISADGKTKNYESNISLNKTIVRNELINEIARLIMKNINDFNISPEEICIVAPQWVHIASVTRKLMVALPDYSFDGPGMAPFSRDVENFWFKLSRIILTEPAPNLYVIRLRWASEILKELEIIGVNVRDYNPKRFLKLCNSINCEEKNGLKYLEIVFDKISEKLNFKQEDYSMLHEHFETFFQSSKNRIDRLKNEGIDFIDQTESFKKVFKQRNGITVSTIHGIKGAEFDVMIGFALLQGYIPFWSDTNGSANSKKMLYVISSRARKNMHLIAEKERYNPRNEEYIITEHLANYDYEYDEP
jgi:DNA helicase II / ATP-dependent DNA helicase PcrA